MKIKYLLFPVLGTLTLFSCGGGSKQKVYLSTMNLLNANSLFIGSVKNANSNDVKNKLFKITENGYVEEVTFTYVDENGKEVQTTQTYIPTNMVKMNDKYLLVEFSTNDNYLVNIETGKCYKYTSEVPNIDYNKQYYQGENLEQDSYGNIYYISSGYGEDAGGVKKLNISDPENVTLSTVSVANEKVRYFGVDGAGNIAYEGTDAGGTGVLRYVATNGSISVLPGSTNHSFTTFWTTPDTKSLYYYNGSTSSLAPTSCTHLLTYPPFTATPVVGTDCSYMGNLGFKTLLNVKNKGRMYFLSSDNMYEIYNQSTKQMKGYSYNTFGITTFKSGICSDNYIYLTGTNSNSLMSIIRINPTTGETKALMNDGRYDIFDWTVDENETISFDAIQMSDGAIVVGTIDNQGNFNISDVRLEKKVEVLEKL